MTDLATAVALVLVLEGLLWALSPDAMKRAAALALGLANEQLRLGGLIAALFLAGYLPGLLVGLSLMVVSGVIATLFSLMSCLRTFGATGTCGSE